MTSPISDAMPPHQVPGGVRFSFDSGTAATVAVAGTFNSWVGDAAPLDKIGPARWQGTLAIAPGRHHYKIVVDGCEWIRDPANPWISEDAQDNSSFTVNLDGSVLIRPGAVTPATPAPLHRHDALASPAWLRDGVVYQLSVRAFGGTFDGVRDKLDYLQELGISVVWLMPVHPIGVARRIGTLGDPYAVRDFMAIDPALGDAASLRALIGELHSRGMRVIFDWTLNRASCDNPLTVQHPEWFARDASGTPIYLVPNRAYFCGFDFSQRALRDWLLAAMQAWVRDFDLDGMRFDDSDITPTDFLDEIRTALQAVRPDIGFISQSTDELHHLRACDLTYDGSVRDFAQRIAGGTATAGHLRREWEEASYSFPRGALRMRWLEEKEQGRAHRYLGAGLHRAAASIQMTLDGVPHVLMGQEWNEIRWSDWRWLFDDVQLDWARFDAATFSHYKALIALRTAHPALRSGSVEWIDGGAPQCLAYRRANAEEQLLVVVNLSAQAQPLPAQAIGKAVLFASGMQQAQLAAYGSAVFRA